MVHILKLMTLVETHKSAPLQAQDGVDHESPQKSALDVSMEALLRYQAGDTSSAERLFADSWEKYSSSKTFQSEYIQLLLRMGKYGKILELRNIEGKKNQLLVNKARECMSKLESGSLEDVAGLVDVSPDSLQVLLACARNSVMKSDLASAEKYLAHAERVAPGSGTWLHLKLSVKFALGKIEDGLDTLKCMGEEGLYRTYADIYRRFLEIRASDAHPQIRYQYLIPLCDKVLMLKISDSHSPSIFNPLYKMVLETMVEIGCDAQIGGVFSYATRLAQMEESRSTIFNLIRAAVVDMQMDHAQALMSRHSSMLGQNRVRYLRSLIQQLLRKIEEKKEAERRERERRMAEERERMQRERATNKAGTDFLSYYKVLGASPSSTPEQLKKAHRRKAREAGKRASANAHQPPEKKDAELKSINKAYQTLSDPEKRRAYDMGIDPEAAPQQSHDSHRHDGFLRENEVDEIFQMLFGRGRGRSRRTQYIFFQ